MDINDPLYIGKTFPRAKKLPFSYTERELVAQLVRERPVIDDKCTNAKNIILKKQAWIELTKAFNSQPYVSKRNHLQLKRCWENMKSQRKKAMSQASVFRCVKLRGIPRVENGTDVVIKQEVITDNNHIPQCDDNISQINHTPQNDKDLDTLRIQREEIAIERERNMLKYEKEIHDLHKEKLKLEIEILKSKIKDSS